jgi:dTDP-4-dehydrorhamnose 3,5-epimerase
MKVTPLALPDVLLIEPRVFADDRGWFTESFNARSFAEATGLDVAFVQDNHSYSRKGTLRGLHYQLPPHAQGKLVRTVAGTVLDIAVDIRRSSPTFGKWVAEELSADNMKQVYIPAGFAHAFLALTDGAELLYKTTDYYDKASERSIRWDDPDLAIAWPPGLKPVLAPKDGTAPAFADADTFD